MARDYYSDAAGAGEQPRSAAKSGPKERENIATTTVPKSMCPGMKVGDNITLKIIADRAQEYQVAYEKGGVEDEEEGSMEQPMPPSPYMQ